MGASTTWRTRRFYRTDSSERVAQLFVVDATDANTFMLKMARGSSPGELTSGSTYGPYSAADVPARLDEAEASLRAEGYLVAPSDLVYALFSPAPKERARAAVRLGWRDDARVVPALVAAGEVAKGDVCSIVDALGRLGDERGLPLARKLAERKNLSRRRSGVEALRNLEDQAGLEAAVERGLDRLPEVVAAAFADCDESKVRRADVEALLGHILAQESQRHGPIADVLYENASPLAVAVSRRVLAKLEVGAPHSWRYVRSVLRRAMLRDDAVMFGFLAHRIEMATQSHVATKSQIKSGFDGKPRATLIFARRTQRYVQRACWRYLRDLARWRPERYLPAAVEVLRHYRESDQCDPMGLAGAWSRAYLLNRIVHGESERLSLRSRSLRWAFRSAATAAQKPAGREESFAAHWDAQPTFLVELLSRSRVAPVTRFALIGVARHLDALTEVAPQVLVRLLRHSDDDVVALGATELDRRFDAAAPDWSVVAAVMTETHPAARKLAREWLARCAPSYQYERDQVLRLLTTAPVPLADHVRTLVQAAIEGPAHERLRQEWAAAYWERVGEPEAQEGELAPLTRFMVGALAGELLDAKSDEELLRALDEGTVPRRVVAGAVLALHANALVLLGLARLVALGEAEAIALRRVVHGLIASAGGAFDDDPSALFALTESRWADTREAAFQRLRALGPERLGLDGIIGLCDSHHDDAQAFGRQLVVERFEHLDAETVLFRLVEHPTQAMRRFALALVRDHLRDGLVPLARIEGFFRACLFDVMPCRELKYGVVDLLKHRGAQDERQAEFVAGILNDFLRSHTRTDFERVAQALATIQLRFPAVQSDVRLLGNAS